MTTTVDWVADWAARLPALTRVSPLHWRAEADVEVSYPSSAHTILGRIEADSYWFNHRNDLISAIVKRYPPSGPMFDVGGGNGYVALGLKANGVDSVVIEPGTHGVSTALERGLPVIEAAYHQLDIPAGSVPAAGLFDVLEHIEDDVTALKGLYDAIEPGGMLYLSVPALAALWSSEDVFAGHYRRYSLRGLKKKVTDAGFVVEYGTYFFGLLTVPVFLSRTIPSKLGAKAKSDDEEATHKQHTLPAGAIGRTFRSSFANELKKVSSGRSLGIGTSCFVAARKPA